MAGLQDIHTHTIYCDGKRTPEEMVMAALEKGCDSFGFSGHANAPFDLKFSMTEDETLSYINDIGCLKEKYAGRIELFTGIEQDYYSFSSPDGFEFVIGTVHYIQKGNKYVSVDAGARNQKQAVDIYFGGDYYTMAEEYFTTVAGVVEKTRADIVGHFDLVTKYNSGGSRFDESNPRYVDAALGAMEEVLKGCRLFEVNTGAMYRQNKTAPYPSAFLLSELCKRGGEVILTSDSHDTESICYKFGEMRDLLKACGFKYMKRLTQKGFIDIKI